MTFTQEQQQHERRFTQADRERIWDLFFGKRWSLGHIGQEYGVEHRQIAAVIDSESARRWRINHPNEKNRERLLSENDV